MRIFAIFDMIEIDRYLLFSLCSNGISNPKVQLIQGTISPERTRLKDIYLNRFGTPSVVQLMMNEAFILFFDRTAACVSMYNNGTALTN